MRSSIVSKRQRVANALPLVAPTISSPEWQGWDDGALWHSLFDSIPLPELLGDNGDPQGSSRKRPRETTPGPTTDNAISVWLNATFPELEPSVWQLPPRNWAPEIPNPFLDDLVMQHPRTRRLVIPALIPQDGCINGLIKVRLHYLKKRDPQPVARLQKFPWSKSKSGLVGVADQVPVDPVSYLPPDFGRGLKLNAADEKLFNFFRVAICGAVTLIPAENCYLREVTPIAARSECVKHAILALAATYILDYTREEHLKTRANFHWKRAVHLLTRELNISQSCQPGKEDAVVAAMAIFSHNEVVNWELEQQREEHPTWYRASYLAEQVLAKSDPLYRYHFPSNVQCSRARTQLGNKIALYNIMSATIWPLETNEERCPFKWLLEGEERDLRRIVGCTGLCPRLMHTYAQITHLSAKLYKDPQRLTAQKLASAISQRLNNFWQWSDLSEGYQTSQELINSCELDENGKVFSPIKTTELVAETYAAAAQIYLYCRLMRKSRRHPKVQEVLARLLWCIDRMPTSGPLFTAQHAQLRVFIAAVVACEPYHRRLIRNWFEELVDGTRGNVPPVWRTVQFMWGWLDARFHSIEQEEIDHSSEMEIDTNAEAWWEVMVADIYAREGKLNLA